MPHYCDTTGLDPYCETDRQREVLDAVRTTSSVNDAAKRLGIDARNVYATINRVRKKAARQGFSPDHGMTQSAPNGFTVSGVSTLYNNDGQIVAQWVKTRQDAEDALEALREARDALFSDLPRERPAPSPKSVLSDLANLYVITDYHIGMRAWPEETGADWDTRLAEDMLVNWFQATIKDAPKAHTGIFCQLGDFLHWDGVEAVTPASGHILDADTRYQKLVRVAIRVSRRIIRMLLQRHEQVHVIMAEGNHDPSSSMWLRELLAAFYEDEPRVTVDVSPDPYYCFEWGLTSLFFHHGHKRKVTNVDDVFVAKFRDVFGRTRHSYAHMGHLHHDKVLETNLMTVEQHRTLAAPDAYASRGGWMSGRSADCITYHKEHGRVGKVEKSPEMVFSHDR